MIVSWNLLPVGALLQSTSAPHVRVWFLERGFSASLGAFFLYFQSRPQAKEKICSVLLSLQADGARRDEADKKEDLAVMDLKETMTPMCIRELALMTDETAIPELLQGDDAACLVAPSLGPYSHSVENDIDSC